MKTDASVAVAQILRRDISGDAAHIVAAMGHLDMGARVADHDQVVEQNFAKRLLQAAGYQIDLIQKKETPNAD